MAQRAHGEGIEITMNTIEHRKSGIGKRRAFTLVELLVVISVMAILAGFTLSVLPAFKRQQYLKTARAELDQVATALENYKAQYGFYPPGNAHDPMLTQLYYELSGTALNGANFATLDGSSTISTNSVAGAYGVSGFVNCGGKTGGEDVAAAKNFLPGLKPNRIVAGVANNSWGNNVPGTTVLITSVGGPDDTYRPLSASGLNPFRYACPGTNNPASYDLWVQLVIRGKTNLVCNWNRQVQINYPLP